MNEAELRQALIVKELEKIKAEIANIPNDETTKPIGIYDYCLGAEHERKIILQIIDIHIEKLKGNAGCDYFTNNTINNCTGIVTNILDKHIMENKQ